MSRYGFKPLKRDPDRKVPRFGVIDIESFKWILFRVIAIGWKSYDEDGHVLDRHYEVFKDISEFCSWLFEGEFPYQTLFAHFGGRFDFSFLLKEFFESDEKYFIGTLIPRGAGLLCFDVSTFKKHDVCPHSASEKDVLGRDKEGRYLIRDKTINFRDSSAMLPFGLASLTENFGVEHKKKEIDYDSFEVITPEMLEYLEYDIWGLYEVIDTYFNWEMIRGSGSAFTVAGQSLRVFRTFLKKDLPSLSPRVDAEVRKSYVGGRTEIFKPFFQQAKNDGVLRSYDVNSLYPYVMMINEFPGSFKFATTKFYENQFGFYDVEVTVPDMYIPPLGVCFEGMENRFIFPVGTFRGHWSTSELNYAMSLGCRINKVYSGMVFNNAGYIFKDYINELYEMRRNADKNSVTNVLCKLLMNSTYGRFGLNLEREQLSFDRGQVGATPHLEIPLNRDGSRIIRLMKNQITLESSPTNVAIASQVTAYARQHVHERSNEAPHEMYYQDTDSLKTTHVYARNDSDLGKLKLEYKVKRACFLLPKTYVEETTEALFKMFDEKGKDTGNKTSKKVVMKSFDKRKTARFSVDDFNSCFEGDLRRLGGSTPEKFGTLKSSLRYGVFLRLIKETPRQVRTLYNKRRVFKRPYVQVYDTEPLHIKNGEITNLDLKILKKWKPPSDEILEAIENRVLDINKE